ncbi:hypothetical protein FRB94_007046 [Tulasnella sp. JGI-2019a]|nr:hypothetical protein FRB94_007046 [Tulasnella sp. JGI-2019a]KAG9016958.1 hypothetical protein FRB93_009488 [Tulasnella sp. JGI-2019a]KAG9040146.1 hypothetical protein FRB95_000075 [Tulasnella sp. JGI-2019a]
MASPAATLNRVVKIIPNRTAFLVCDVQERMWEIIPSFRGVVNTSAKMVRMAEILKVPVIVTEQTPNVFKPTVPEVIKQLSALSPELRHGPFLKTKFAMTIPEVMEALKEIQSVVLFGVESHICVLQTALGMLELGKDVHILADGVTSVNQEEVSIAIARMRQAGAQITTSESLLFQFLGDATDPRFRAFNKISKEEKERSIESLRTLLGGEQAVRLPTTSGAEL